MATELLAARSLPNAEIDALAPAAAGRVYDRLLDDILAGHVPAGARLKVTELAKRYGTSSFAAKASW